MTKKGSLFIVSAPSGAGKTSLISALTDQMANLQVSVSHTTRAKRSGEIEGVNYHFVSKKEFNQIIEQCDFLESAEVFGNNYGTSKKWVNEQLKGGIDIILEIDWQGALQIRKAMPEAIGVFILPPSKETLQSRLTDRGQDDQSIIEKRMGEATKEMSHYPEYDFLVVNDDFEVALSNIKAIINARRLSLNVQKMNNSQLLLDLLS